MVKQKLQQITSNLYELKRFFQAENYGKTLQYKAYVQPVIQDGAPMGEQIKQILRT